jgi:hypothetical protein
MGENGPLYTKIWLPMSSFVICAQLTEYFSTDSTWRSHLSLKIQVRLKRCAQCGRVKTTNGITNATLPFFDNEISTTAIHVYFLLCMTVVLAFDDPVLIVHIWFYPLLDLCIYYMSTIVIWCNRIFKRRVYNF